MRTIREELWPELSGETHPLLTQNPERRDQRNKCFYLSFLLASYLLLVLQWLNITQTQSAREPSGSHSDSTLGIQEGRERTDLEEQGDYTVCSCYPWVLHLQIWSADHRTVVSTVLVLKASPRTNPTQILRDDCNQHSPFSFSCMQLPTWQYSQNNVLSCESCVLKLRYTESGQLILICSQSLNLKFKYLSWDIIQLNHNFTYMLYELFCREISR